MKPTLRIDVPSEAWLFEQQVYAGLKEKNRHGISYHGKITGTFDAPVLLPVRELVKLRGQNGEQALRRHARITDEYEDRIRRDGGFKFIDPPYIEVDYEGVPTISEGNHRVAGAFAAGLTEIPCAVRFFDGGERGAPAWLVTADELKAAAHRAWHRDSKVFNADGTPREVFHGTVGDFDKFEPSEDGAFGPGIYFTDTFKGAMAWAPTGKVITAHIRLVNPYSYQAKSTGFPKDFPLQNDLISKGHDGIVVTYPNGGNEFVAFKASQVRIVKRDGFDNEPADVEAEAEALTP
jgi:hypothetical protein